MRKLHDETQPDPRSILVVLPTWVGDVVMATPTLEAIRNRFLGASITYLIRPNVREVIAGSPWMDDVVAWPPRDAKGRQPGAIQLAVQLRRRRLEWAVLLTNSFRSALVTRLAGIRRRIGYDRDGRGWLLTDRLAVARENGRIVPTRMVDYYGRLAWAMGCEAPGDKLVLYTRPEDDRAVQRRLERSGLADHHPLVFVAPGASFGPAKCWPAERFADVCDRLIDRFDARVIITHGPGEEEIAAQVMRSTRYRDREGPLTRRLRKSRRDFASHRDAAASQGGAAITHAPAVLDNPRPTLGELKSLIKRGDLLLCNDTGPRHFAKAFDVPVVTVFGPTAPEWTDTDYAMERKVRINVDCGPCQKKVCPPGHLQCMTGVSVDAVFDAAEELLTRRLAGTG